MRTLLTLTLALLLIACGGGNDQPASDPGNNGGSGGDTKASQTADPDAIAKRVGELLVAKDLDGLAKLMSTRVGPSKDALAKQVAEATAEMGAFEAIEGTDENWQRGEGGTGEDLDFPASIPAAERRARVVVTLRTPKGMADIWLNLIDEDGQIRVATVEMGWSD